MQITLGIFFGVAVSLVARRMGALSNSGAWAAALTGSLIFGLGGLPWAALLLTFFISSSLLSRAFKTRKTVMSEKYAKGSRRDWGQVLANGGLGALLVMLFALSDTTNPVQGPVLSVVEGPVLSVVEGWIWFAYAGAIAAVNADTWATELGVLNPRRPRLITSGRPVDPGTSGGISPYGTLATLAGAALVGLVSAFFSPAGTRFLLVFAATLGGLCGSLFDSLLGGTIQAIYTCSNCNKETERHPIHTCGTQTTQIRGWSWLNNDLVNFLASIVGALIAGAIYCLYSI